MAPECIVLRREVRTVLLLKIRVFWDVTLWYWVSGSWYFEGTMCLYL